jgi:hypothetical protein
MARGDIERRADGGWVLHGQPPEPRASAGATALPLDRRARA